MRCKLSDICSYRKGKIEVKRLNNITYISTENMLPNKGGITEASSLPSIVLTQEYRKGDVLVSNIRPYFKKIWQAKYDGGCSNDVLVFTPNPMTDKDFLYYVLANDEFFLYSMATSKGTKMPRGDKDSIMQYEIPDIGLDRQRKIASVLKSLDDKIQLNIAINKNLPQDSLISHLFLNLLKEIKTLGLERNNAYQTVKDGSKTYRLTLDSSYDINEFQKNLRKELEKESDRSLLYECDVLITDQLSEESLVFNGGDISVLTEKEIKEISGMTSSTIEKMKKDCNRPKVIRLIDRKNALGELR